MPLLSATTAWCVAAGVLVVAELLSGTVYLLMLSLGMGAAAVAAQLGAPGSGQLIAAALVGGGTTLLWHWRVRRRGPSLPAGRDRDVNLDIGERVQVQAWEPGGLARVNYRGSTWSARLAPGAVAAPGWYIVIAVEANSLVLAPAGQV